MRLLWEDRVWDDYLYWQTQDKKTIRRINGLIKDIQRSTFEGIGKPEPLKENLSDMWSRRVDDIILILEYLLLVFGISALCMLLCKISQNHIFNFILYGIESASPAISVIIMLLCNKQENLKEYIHNKYISNLSLKKCLWGFFIPFIILTFAKIVTIFIGDIYIYPDLFTIRKMVIILWSLVAEELGWRGYLQDKFEKNLSYKYIPLFTGIIWAMWHYHFMLSGSMNVPIVAFTLGCVFESYGYFTITKLAKNNIVPASIFHFTGNMMFNVYRFAPQWHDGNNLYYWIMTAFYALNLLIFILLRKEIYNIQKDSF